MPVTDDSFSMMCFYNVELLSGSRRNARVPMEVSLFGFF